METRLHYDLAQKQLCFLMKERVVTDPNIHLRFHGALNTVTGVFDYRGSLKKYVQSGALLKGEGTQPLQVGAGVGISKASGDEPFLTVAAKKQIALLEGPDTVLHAKAMLEYEPRSSKVLRRARVAISRRFLGFTAHQDLLLKAGLQVDWPSGVRTLAGGDKPKPEPFFQVRENNWALHYRRGGWQVTYDL